MDREQFKISYRYARRHAFKGGQSVAGLYFSLSAFTRMARAQVEPRRTYWAVLSQNMDRINREGQGASVADRAFYVKRARAIRRAGFRDNWAGC